MAKCQQCGTEIDLPFKCNYCGGYFCETHRLLEGHNCSQAPPRNPLGSHSDKRRIAEVAYEKKMATLKAEVPMIRGGKDTYTDGNIHGHRFIVPIEAYDDEEYRERLNSARTLAQAEDIIRDYRKHHKKK